MWTQSPSVFLVLHHCQFEIVATGFGPDAPEASEHLANLITDLPKRDVLDLHYRLLLWQFQPERRPCPALALQTTALESAIAAGLGRRFRSRHLALKAA